MDTYLRSHLVSSRIADAQASATRQRLVRGGSPARGAIRTESVVGRVVGAFAGRLPQRPLTPGVDPRKAAGGRSV